MSGVFPRPRPIGGLLRGLRILDMFDEEHTGIGIPETAAELTSHKSSASRLAATLAYVGYLVATPTPGGSYRLGGRASTLR